MEDATELALDNDDDDMLKGKGKGRVQLLAKLHLTATECHLSYEITQCYRPPDTSEHTSPQPQPDRLVLDLPIQDGWKAELS